MIKCLSIKNFFLPLLGVCFGVQIIVQDVVFPLLCHTSEDDQLWNSDPIEYIRTKYGQNQIIG